MPKTKMKCRKCGFTTTLVYVDDAWKCDVESHGNSAPGKKCFNCQALFVGTGGQNEQVDEREAVPAGEVQDLLVELEKVRAENAELQVTIDAAKLTKKQKDKAAEAVAKIGAEEPEPGSEDGATDADTEPEKDGD